MPPGLNPAQRAEIERQRAALEAAKKAAEAAKRRAQNKSAARNTRTPKKPSTTRQKSARPTPKNTSRSTAPARPTIDKRDIELIEAKNAELIAARKAAELAKQRALAQDQLKRQKALISREAEKRDADKREALRRYQQARRQEKLARAKVAQLKAQKASQDRLAAAIREERAATEVSAKSRDAWDKVRRTHEELLEQARLVDVYGERFGNTLKPREDGGPVAPRYQGHARASLGRSSMTGKDDPGLKDAKSVLEEARRIRKRQRASGGKITESERLVELDMRMEALVDEWVTKHAPILLKAQRLAEKAKAGNKSAVKQLLAMAESDEVKEAFRIAEELFPNKPGKLGIFDRYIRNRNDIATEARRFQRQMLVEAGAVDALRLGADELNPSDEDFAEAERVRDLFYMTPGGGFARYEHLRVEQAQEQVKGFEDLYKRHGQLFEPHRLADSRYLRTSADMWMADWEAKFWAPFGGRSKAMVGLGRDEARELVSRFEREREQEEKRLYSILGSDRPGTLSRILEAVIESPNFMGAMEMLQAIPSAFGFPLRVADAFSGGESLGPDIDLGALGKPSEDDLKKLKDMTSKDWDEVTDALKASGYDLKQWTNKKKGEGFSRYWFRKWVYETDEGQAWWAQYMSDNPSPGSVVKFPAESRPGSGAPAWAPFWFDTSDEAKANIAEQMQRAAQLFGSEDLGDRLRGLNEVGMNPMAEDAGNLVNVPFQFLADPLIMLKPSHLIRIARLAKAQQSANGIGKGLSTFLTELGVNRFGFADMSPGLAAYVDLSGMSKFLGRKLFKYTDVSEEEVYAYLENMKNLAKKDPTDQGLRARLERLFGRKLDNPQQLQAASEAFIRRWESESKIRIIDGVDQARLRQSIDDILEGERIRRADAAADEADEIVEARQRSRALEVETTRARKQLRERASPHETHRGFETRAPGDFRAPTLKNKHSAVDGPYHRTWYGKRAAVIDADSSRVAVEVDARHMQDSIAIADGIARRYEVGVRWVHGPGALNAPHRRPAIELYGGTPEEMALVADELQDLLRKNRLGKRSQIDGYHSYGDGRVVYQAGKPEADSALREAVERLMARKKRILRSDAALEKVTRELAALRAKFGALEQAAATGDREALRAFTRSLHRQETLAARAGHLRRFRENALASLRDAGGDRVIRRGNYYDSVHRATVGRMLKGEQSYIELNIKHIEGLLKKPQSPARQVELQRKLEWFRDALAGQRVLMEDLQPHFRFARKMRERHAAEAAQLVRPAAIAPKTSPSLVARMPGKTTEEVADLQISMGLRSRAAAGDVYDEATAKQIGWYDQVYDEKGLPRSPAPEPRTDPDPDVVPIRKPSARFASMSDDDLLIESAILNDDMADPALKGDVVAALHHRVSEPDGFMFAERLAILLANDPDQAPRLYNFFLRAGAEPQLNPFFELHRPHSWTPDWDEITHISKLPPLPDTHMRVFRGNARGAEGAIKIDTVGWWGRGTYSTNEYELAEMFSSEAMGGTVMSLIVPKNRVLDLRRFYGKTIRDALESDLEERGKAFIRDMFEHRRDELFDGISEDDALNTNLVELFDQRIDDGIMGGRMRPGGADDYGPIAKKHGYGAYFVDTTGYTPVTTSKELVVVDPYMLRLERADVRQVGDTLDPRRPHDDVADAAAGRALYQQQRADWKKQIVAVRKDAREARALEEAIGGHLVLPEFRVDVQGPFYQVYPVFRALLEQGVKLEDHPRLQAWMLGRLEEAKRAGIRMEKKGDLGMRPARDVVSEAGEGEAKKQKYILDPVLALEQLARGSYARMADDVGVPSWELYRRIDAEVTEAVNAALGRPKVKRWAGTSSLFDEVEVEDVGDGVNQGFMSFDQDLRAVQAKIEVLSKYGWSVQMYDDARQVLRRSLIEQDRFAALHEQAQKLVASGTFKTYDEAFDWLRAEAAEELGGMLLQSAARVERIRKGDIGVAEVYARFRQKMLDDELRVPVEPKRTRWQQGLMERAVADLSGLDESLDVLDDAAWHRLVAPIAPDPTNAKAAREFLEEIGLWTPKTGEDIRAGRQVYGAVEEAQYWRGRWGIIPDWANIEKLKNLGVFDSAYTYAKTMREMGVFDSTVETELRISGDEAFEQQMRLIWGNEEEGIKPLRSVAEKRQWMQERWGSRTFEEHFPWLKDPGSESYARWYARVRKDRIDATLMTPEEGKALRRVLEKRGPHEVDELVRMATDDVVAGQEFLQRGLALTDDLLANPRWRPMLSRKYLGRQRWGYAALSTLGFVQRLFIVTDPAFPILNRMETARFIGPKRGLANLSIRGTRRDVPEEVVKWFPNIESTGIGAGTMMWEVFGGGSPARAKAAVSRLRGPAPSADDVWDMLAAGTRATTELGFTISAKGENSLKLDMFHRLFADRYYKLLDEGLDPAHAKRMAQSIAAERVKRFLPQLAEAHPVVKVLNDIIPFLHYSFESARLYAREFLSHPWVAHKMWVVGNAVEQQHIENWEREHPDVPYESIPASLARQMRMLQVTVGGETFEIDLLSASDIFRGWKAIVMFSDGEPRHLDDYIKRFIRIPHPQQERWINWSWQTFLDIMGEPEWASGERVSLGEMMFAAKALEWWNKSMEDGSVSQADFFRMATRMAFFAEAETVDPLRALSAQWGALDETNPEAAEKFLQDHPELQGYWDQLMDTPERARLREQGILPKSFVKQLSPSERAAHAAAVEKLQAIEDHFDARLAEYLGAGGSPTDAAYKALKEEKYRAMTTFRFKNQILKDKTLFYSASGDWGDPMQRAYVDGLWDKWEKMNAREPKREDFESDLAFARARRDFYAQRSAFLEAHPEMLRDASRERTVLEDAVARHYDRIGDRLALIGQNDVAIAKAEAKGKDDLADALRFVNDLAWADVNRGDAVYIEQGAPEFSGFNKDIPLDRQADAIAGLGDVPFMVALPGLQDQRWRDADEKQRAQMKRDYWYITEIGKVHDAANDGADWIRRMERRPDLLKEYLARNPEKAQHWRDRRYYFERLDETMATIKRTGDWSHWWKLLESDKRFRQYYLQTHPEKVRSYKSDLKAMRKVNDLARKAEEAGDWSIFVKGLEKNKGAKEWWLSLEPGRKARWDEAARYYRTVFPVLDKAVKTGDWKAFRELLRTDKQARRQFFKHNPKAEESWLRDEAYRGALSRWYQLSKADRQAEASDYFASLPRWMQQRFLRENSGSSIEQKSYSGKSFGRSGGSGGGGLSNVQFNAYVTHMKRWGNLFETQGGEAAMRYFNNLPSWMREFYFRNNPGKREQFAANDAYGAAMRRWISFFDREDYDGARKYFDSLPQWMRDRYYANNPDKRPGARSSSGNRSFSGPPPWELDDAQSKRLGEYLMLTAQEKAAYLKAHPDFAKYLRQRGDSEDTRRAQILAGYKGLPADPWLRRVYRERFPEVFSEEAQGLRREQKFQEFLTKFPWMADEVAEAVDLLTKTYLAQTKFYGAPPKSAEVTRLTEEEKIRRRRKISRSKPEWQIAGDVPVIVPGKENVLTGVA